MEDIEVVASPEVAEEAELEATNVAPDDAGEVVEETTEEVAE